MEKWTELDASELGPVGSKFFKFATERIKGQDKAVRKLARALDRQSSAFKVGTQPIYIALLVGGAGSGKTLLAKVLAEFWFGSRDSYIEVACSDFLETNFSQAALNQFDLTRLKSESPKFAKALEDFSALKDAYMQSAQAVDAAAEKNDAEELKKAEEKYKEAEKSYQEASEKLAPVFQTFRSVIVLDHIEDGPSRLQDELSMIFGRGVHYDKNGSPVSFRNSVIFVTCNSSVSVNDAAVKKVGFSSGASASSGKQRYLNNIDEIKNYLTAKFLSHFDRVEIFREYDEKNRLEILEILINEFQSEVAKNFPLKLSIGDDVKKFIAKEASDHPEQGIRLLRRKFDKYIRDKVATLIARKLIKRADELKASLKEIKGENEVVFSKNTAE